MSNFIKEIVELNEIEVIELLKNKLEKKEVPLAIMDEIKVAMKTIGDKFQNKEYFLPDLIMSGEILRKIFEILGPELKTTQKTDISLGNVLLGTVQGDIHDIGKDIVKFMLESNGFEVVDLGIDVPPEKFVESMNEFKPSILALSGFLTIAFDAMKITIQLIKSAGLRDSVKIMIGGGTIDENIVEYVGADAYGESAVDAVNLAKEWSNIKG
ncbi:MAG: B12-binding domain-containing protein [Candidatus Hermodarchaeota archaeon]